MDKGRFKGIESRDKYQNWKVEWPRMPEKNFRSWLLNPKIMQGTDKVTDQCMYICDPEGNLKVDFVGRFERLEQDWKFVCSKIGKDLTLPWVKTSSHQPNRVSWKEYYDQEMKTVARALFKRDFDKFGYEG